jgi:hypothetical protein
MDRCRFQYFGRVAAILAAAGLALPLINDLPAAEPAASVHVDFNRDIRPLLAERCFACHGEQKREGGLRLSNRRDAFTPGDSGTAAIKPSDSAGSLLIERVTADADSRMPPQGELLSAGQIELLRRWIEQGAKWPDETGPVRHWAYIQPQRPPLPSVRQTDWPLGPIDCFILARLEREGLHPSPPASRAALARRLSLDLRGLPPSPAEVEAFVADTSADAYERLVDRWLASPQYGERWARHWLDLARYADSNGFQRDGFRDLWAYRDWVVRAMNADMPFDQFTIEQIAGDLLPQATLDQQIATGFHRCTTVNVEAGTDQEENRVNQVIDRVNTTGTVWLGTTIECAQCHNHKYDPFTQQEYYRLLAFFNNTEIETAFRGKNSTAAIDFTGPMIELPDPQHKAQRERLTAELAALDTQIAKLTKELKRQPADELPPPSDRAATWHVLSIANFASAGGSSGSLLEDHSVLVGGETPDKDTYTIEVATTLKGITGFKLETLTDPSLPGEGPGRGDEERPNFILNKVTVTAAARGDKEAANKIELHSPQADFSQRGWDVAGAIDNDPKSGWAINPQFHKPHEASFLFREPVGDGEECLLTFRLEQNYGGGRSIGRLRLSALTGQRDAAALPDEVAKILAKPAKKRTKKERETLQQHQIAQNPEIKRLQEQRARLEKELEKLDPPQSLVMQELPEPRETHMFIRGDFLNPGPEVEPGVPEVLHRLPAGEPNRLTLARWLVDRDNPLVARVAVNRWWAELFGHGLVATLEDFGLKGEPPTHPELLDWLAVEFMESGWSMKHLHKQIVMSATYQQSSHVSADLLAKDDQNKLYARGPRFRMDAEMIRDNALTIAGLLSLKQGGPPVKPYQPEGLWRVTGLVDNTYKVSNGEDRYRRGLYVVWRRSAPYPSFMNFDAQIRATCIVKRSRSNTPLQALTLLNDPVYVEAALAFARRVTGESASHDAKRLKFAFAACLARGPSATELAALEKLLAASRDRYRKEPESARRLLKPMLDSEQAGSSEIEPQIELAAWFEVCTVLLNLDETITKN